MTDPKFYFLLLAGILIMFSLVFLSKKIAELIFISLKGQSRKDYELENKILGKKLETIYNQENDILIAYKDEDKLKYFEIPLLKNQKYTMTIDSLYGISASTIYKVDFKENYIFGKYLGTEIEIRTINYIIFINLKPLN